MADHSKFVALAVRLIEKNGRFVSLQKISGTTVGSPTPWKNSAPAAPTSIVQHVPAVFVPVSGKELGSIITDKDMLKRVTQVALIAPHTEDLSEMTEIIDREVWRVEWVHILKPADQICLYAFGLTR